jgi:hypothetical protein
MLRSAESRSFDFCSTGLLSLFILFEELGKPFPDLGNVTHTRIAVDCFKAQRVVQRPTDDIERRFLCGAYCLLAVSKDHVRVGFRAGQNLFGGDNIVDRAKLKSFIRKAPP